MVIVRGVNAGLSFLLEVAMLAALIYWGFAAHRWLPLKLFTGIGLPVVLIAFWGLLMAPNATHRLPWPGVPIVALALFPARLARALAGGTTGVGDDLHRVGRGQRGRHLCPASALTTLHG